jgi:multisubunit Na+/H+ antiporter MnhC subunit
MTNCIHCGTFIDTANPQTVYYTVKLGVYECKTCHNADINEPEDTNAINPVEAFVIVLTAIVIMAIFWLVL